jgi:hypothetical protein
MDEKGPPLTPKPRGPVLVPRSVLLATLALAGCGGRQQDPQPPEIPPQPGYGDPIPPQPATADVAPQPPPIESAPQTPPIESAPQTPPIESAPQPPPPDPSLLKAPQPAPQMPPAPQAAPKRGE